MLQRQVDVGGLAAERRADDPDDRERRAVQVELRADLQRVLRPRTSRETSASLPPAAARKRPFVTCDGGDDADVGLVWSTPPIVYAVVVMLVCGGSSTCCSVCSGVVNCVRKRCRLAGRHFWNRARSRAACRRRRTAVRRRRARRRSRRGPPLWPAACRCRPASSGTAPRSAAAGCAGCRRSGRLSSASRRSSGRLPPDAGRAASGPPRPARRRRSW